MIRKLLTTLPLVLSLNLQADWHDPEYEILITQLGLGVKGNLEHAWRDTIWVTINRYFDEMYYQYVNGDEIHFRITHRDGYVYYMYGCVIGNELIITAADPLWCPEERNW